jgi:hypothetical protein
VKVVKATLGIAIILGSVILGASAAFGSTAPSTQTGGSVNLYLSGSQSSRGNILITGAIGDYGKVRRIKGQKDFSLVKLHKGTFEINTSKLIAATNSATPTRNTATCSDSRSETAPVTLLDGTGLYAGISGTLNFTVYYAETGPLYTSGSHKGQCNMSNSAVPYAQFATALGMGTVSFS